MNPIAFHFNGKALSKYDNSVVVRLEEQLDKSKLARNSTDVQVFTYDDKLSNPFLINCCNKLNINLINLALEVDPIFLKKEYPVNDNYPNEKFTLLFKLP